jgi:hypothetical protein
MAEQKSSSALTAPLRGAASVLRRVPGAGMVSRAAEETLDKVGAVSPRGRRIAVYAGAGMLGAAGVVEWPVALTGAAVAWLTQPRPPHPADGGTGDAGQEHEPAHDLGTAALRSGHGAGARGTGGTEEAASAQAGTRPGGAHGHEPSTGGTEAPPGSRTSGRTRSAGSTRTTHGADGPAGKPSAGPLGPTARPDRTTF